MGKTSERAPYAEHFISRPDWAVSDKLYASWGQSCWAVWHCECPIWYLWLPDPKKQSETYPSHYNREDFLRTRMASLDAAGTPYHVHTVRHPSHSLQAMLDRITMPSDTPIIQQVGRVTDTTMTEPAPPPAMTAPPEPAYITIEDVAKVDLRIGLVVEAERVPKSDKLLKLQIDLGEGVPRQVLAGIGKGYTPEEMIGKYVAVVANLPPRKMMGHESRGMVLAAGETPEDLALLTPTKTVKPGSRLR